MTNQLSPRDGTDLPEAPQRSGTANGAGDAAGRGGADGPPLSGTHLRRQFRADTEYSHMLSRISIIHLELGADGTVLNASTAAANLLGYQPDELRGKHGWALFFPGALQERADVFRARLHAGDVSRQEIVLSSRDGSEVTLVLNSANQYRADGSLERIILTGVDATLHKQIERELDEYRARMERLMAENTSDLVRSNEALQQEIAERKQAEGALRLLSDVSAMLASSLDYAPKLSKLARLLVPFLADWCVIDMLEEDSTIRRLAIAHGDPSKVDAVRRLQRHYQVLPSNAQHSIVEVFRSKQTLLNRQFTPERLAAGARDPEHLALLQELGYQSEIVAPLIARSQVLGTITVVYGHSGRRYGPSEQALMEELAQRVAIAVDNARLYYETRQARQAAERTAQRTARLQAITAALSGALTPSQVANAILREGVPATDAEEGSVIVLGDDGTHFELLYETGYSEPHLGPFRRFPLDAPVPIADAARTRQPIWLESPNERNAHYPASPTLDVRQGAWAALPLIVNERALGGLGLSFATARRFSDDDKAFMMALARHCAQALERARLYEQVQNHAEILEQKVAERTQALEQALAQARNAEKAKNVLLATISHEMRTPLSSIQGFAHLALTRRPAREKLVDYLRVIHSESRRLAGLVDDFLDLQRLEAGAESFHFLDLDLADLICTIASEQPIGEDSSHRIRLDLSPVPKVRGDGQRLRQVIVNLLSNAIKFSPQGGEITVSLRREGQEVICSIRDQGLGIPPEELNQLFELFWRGEAAEQYRIRGTGLGLTLCEEIIDRHGGRIWATSEGAEQGATFSFTLPVPTPA
jgi:PAS domain S-box-containing protein